ncbi:VIT family-domain-containing protein [Bombardia bombarda]|uniref:VIT family-domain-containing protein n=1 Tax=Bombardia bombarda TaxID=252184 RepID=A0AA40BVC4_9PEZI|nr:VIT family-domain-containing protein [Bombardia bombarda]
MPRIINFLADFTLGFADGLTVPFALTAGLSSLGQTKTVIYAGMAEICAGSISMGIGGYLATRGENVAARREQEAADSDAAASGTAIDGDDDDNEATIVSGLSVSLGYLLGGILPLFPYFFVSHVGDGLFWSFLVCVVALFTFGFTKDFLLNNKGGSKDADGEGNHSSWPRIPSSYYALAKGPRILALLAR